MKLLKIKHFAVAMPFLLGSGAFTQDVTSYTYTGAVQTYTVPAGITLVQVEAWGAQGQALTIEDYDGSVGGLGGYSIGELVVTPGEVLTIYVGGTGTEDIAGFNGGAIGGFGSPSDGDSGRAGSGGGASDIRQGGAALTDRIIVAGGGGGGGRDYVNGTCVPCGTGGNGGVGGALTGGDGDDPDDLIYMSYYNVGAGGKGGTPAIGGAGGDGTEGVDGNAGILGVGGVGIDGLYSTSSGGGGGGYYGGGSGASANSGSGAGGGGGAGGSSYLGTLTDASTTPGLRVGDGQIIITELCFILDTTVSALEICEGQELLLSALSLTGGTITWDDMEVTNGIPFIPSTTGTVTYTATSDAASDCLFEIDITIHEAPEVIATVDFASICMGDELTLTGGGADSYLWNYDAMDGVTYIPTAGPGLIEFKVIGTEFINGCIDSAIVEVMINENPTVIANADEDIYCDGDLITLTGSGADMYSWSLGVDDGIAFSQAIGTVNYTVTGTAATSCIGIDSIEVTVFENPAITLTSTDELYGGDGTTTLVIDLGLAPFEFDWDNDGTGDFDDDQDLTDLPAGTYWVTMTDSKGCSVTESIVVNTQLSINELNNQGLIIYPNPTLANITIVQTGEYEFNLISLSGGLIMSGLGSGNKTVDLTGLAVGMYLLNITTSNGDTKTVKLVKK